MIVADTNLVVYLLLRGSHALQSEAVYRKDPHWVAPRLWRSEFRNTLGFYMRQGRLGLDDALARMQAAELLMGPQDFDVPSGVALKLAAGSGCTAYDCEFVSLAEDLNVPLVTSDRQVLAKFKAAALSPEAFCAR